MNDPRSLLIQKRKVYHETIGWMTKIARSVTTAKVYLQLGGGSIIVGYAVSLFNCCTRR